MAFFERTDERDKLVVCNICNVKCSERSLTSHRMKCSIRHKDMFKSGELIRCSYDSGHIIKLGEMDDHLEFCIKRQNNLLADFQRDIRLADAPTSDVPESTSLSFSTNTNARSATETADDWNREADENPFSFKLSKLRIS